MRNEELSKLRELPIEAVAERLGMQVERHKALCPFHDDRHPSLSFSVSRNTYKCFVCGASGGTIDLAMKVLGVPFKDASKWLADEHNIITTEYVPAVKPIMDYPPDVEFLSGLVRRPVLNDKARRFLFEERRYNPKVVEWLGVSSINVPTPCWRHGKPFYEAPSLLFPYRDIDGRVLNVQSRLLEKCEGKPRFRFPRNSRIHVFNLPVLRWLKDNEPLYVSEGVTDCIALLSSGKKAIAIPSATMLKDEDFAQLSAFHKCLNLHVYPDRDAPGERLYHNLLDVANRVGACLTRHELPDGCKDYSEAYIRNCPLPTSP